MQRSEIHIGKHYAVRHNQSIIVVQVMAYPTGRRRRIICKSMKANRSVLIDPTNFRRETPLGLHKKPDLKSQQQRDREARYQQYRIDNMPNPAMSMDEFDTYEQEHGLYTPKSVRKEIEDGWAQMCETDHASQ